MSKVTEQDLLDMGFEKKGNPVDGYWLEKSFKHKLLNTVYVFTDTEIKSIFVGYRTNVTDLMNHIIVKPLSHMSLKMFIDFAKGDKL